MYTLIAVVIVVVADVADVAPVAPVAPVAIVAGSMLFETTRRRGADPSGASEAADVGGDYLVKVNSIIWTGKQEKRGCCCCTVSTL